jgi:ABC-type multidrug transport system fused ATPase/permease subunit
LSIVIALIITYFINWVLMLVLVAAIIIYAFILWQAVPQLSGLQKKMHRAYNRAYGDAYDALGNVREIKQAATEQQEQKKVHRNFLDRAAQFWVDMNTIFARLTFFQKMVVTLTQLSIFIISIFYVRSGALTPGGLVAFNAYAAMILGPFVILGQNWQVIQNGFVALVRSEKIINTPTEIYEPKGGVAVKKLRGDVAFENVWFSYKGGNNILKGISFHVQPGEKVALVGVSGMGKTTIIDLVSGFYFPQKGRVSVDRTDIRKLNLTAYRSRIGVVPQEPALFNDTAEENIRYGNPGKSREEMITAAKEAHAHTFIEEFPKKYKQLVGWRGIKLSIGQKQRIALARAFLRSPDILVLDEPTSALDARSEQLIKESLRKLMEGRTTFIIAHRLSTVREADRILVLNNGVIAEQGKHEELMKLPNGIYRSLYELQTGFTV